jgi:hypothetical protein
MGRIGREAHLVLRHASRARVVAIPLAFLILSVSTISAQTYVFGRADFAAGAGPSSVVTGDFNGDGIVDMVVTNFNDNTVSVLLGNPDGTFAAQSTYPTGTGPIAVAAGDFNGDGNLDLVVADENCQGQGRFITCSPSGISILLGIGDGTFQPRIDYSTGSGAAAVGAADFNGDGRLDLAVVNSVDGTVSILLGNGDGTFQNAVSYAIPGGQQAGPQSSIAIADFNSDHTLDVVADIGNGAGAEASILRGNGDGTFATPVSFSSNAGGSLATADFNQDKKLDLAIAGNGSVEVYWGNGDGTFNLDATYAALYGNVVCIADFNGDGKPDLAVSGPAGASALYDSPYSIISVLLGNGDGTFQTSTHYGTELATQGMVAFDFNGDGEMDLALTDSGSPGYVSVLLGNGNGTFVDKMNQSAGGSALFFASADFNNDGKLDLAIGNINNDSVSVLPGNGDGTFGSPTTFPTAHLPSQVAVGDFRNDGNTDLAVVTGTCYLWLCGPGSVSVLLGNGDGTFRPHVEYGVGVQPAAIVVGDFRGNGKLDLAVSNYDGGGGNTVSILLGNGDGTFQSHIDYATLGPAAAIATGDFNGDGKLDLVTCNSSVVSVVLGNGDGTFQPPSPGTPIPAGDACGVWLSLGGSPMATGDFNGDGKLDVAIKGDGQATNGQDAISILLGNGDGTFQPPVRYAGGCNSAVGLVAAADFNGDGKLDLAVAGEFDGSTSLLLGNGDGTFQRPLIYPILINPDGSSFLGLFHVGDFNGDGVPDWAVTNDKSQVWVMLGSFKAVSPAALNFGSQGVGTTSAVRSLTISNPTDVPLTISGINANGDFSQNSNCRTILKPGAHCALSVTFSPTATGFAQGKITITDTTRSSNKAIVLTGSGVDGPFLTPYPRRVSFAAAAVGTKSPSAAITLLNSGNAAVGINGIGITGPDSSDFSQTSNCGTSLPVGGSCTVKVAFTPGGGGSRRASVVISDTAPGSPQAVALSGFGTGLALGVAPGGSSSATVPAGQMASYSLVIGGAGFSGPVALTCTGAPAGAICSVPANLNVTNEPLPFMVTVKTTSRTGAALTLGGSAPSPWFYAIGFLGVVFLPYAAGGRCSVLRLVRSFPLFVILLLCSCGGGSSGSQMNGTPVGTYPLTVKAVSGSTSQSIALTLVVK